MPVAPNPFIFLLQRRPANLLRILDKHCNNTSSFLACYTIISHFAYYEASFFFVRLLQTFSAITIAPDAQTSSSRQTAWTTEDTCRLFNLLVIRAGVSGPAEIHCD
ncbi:hypothetical protein C8R44DRAFT_889849 [Mycena epipterygia]|nr:hypothetical protein C8R44DRAFT_889849 [Mycena epipterygia]